MVASIASATHSPALSSISYSLYQKRSTQTRLKLPRLASSTYEPAPLGRGQLLQPVSKTIVFGTSAGRRLPILLITLSFSAAKGTLPAAHHVR